MKFTPELIAWIALISIGWLVLGIGFGMLFGKAMNLPSGDDTYRHAERGDASKHGPGVAPSISTKAEGGYS